MPLYEYQCGNCGKIFDMLRRIIEFPVRHSKKVERMLSTFAAGGCSASGSRGFI